MRAQIAAGSGALYEPSRHPVSGFQDAVVIRSDGSGTDEMPGPWPSTLPGSKTGKGGDTHAYNIWVTGLPGERVAHAAIA